MKPIAQDGSSTSAAERVFAVHELLEMILLELFAVPCKTCPNPFDAPFHFARELKTKWLPICQKVNKTFKAGIDGSPKLQAELTKWNEKCRVDDEKKRIFQAVFGEPITEKKKRGRKTKKNKNRGA